MLAVILAAGRGKRLRPLTYSRSKPMLPVVGKPMVERVMDMLARGGVDRFVVVVYPQDRALIEYLSHLSRTKQVRLAYQEQRQGMAHALECAVPLLRSDGARDFVLASCDNIYPQGHVAALISQMRQGDLDAVLTLLRVRPALVSTLAVVTIRDGLVTHIVEKTCVAEAPSDLGVPALYALSVSVLDYLPHVPFSARGEREFPDALGLLIENGGRVGGLLAAWRMMLTQPPDLLALNRHFLSQDPACAIIQTPLPGDVDVVPPVYVEAEVELGAGCCIGPVAYLEAGCRVGTGATVRRAVVLRSATVEAGALIEDALAS